MTAKKHTTPIFGRTKERRTLRDRISMKGVTVLAGRPRIGKTRLLLDLRDQLGDGDEYLVGYKMGTGSISELVLHSLADLYSRWLQSASFVRQGRALFKDRKEGLITRFGAGFGNVIAPLLETVDPTGMSPEFVKGIFSKLAQLDEDQRTGGLSLEPVSYDQTLNLVHLLVEIENKPMLFILDAFEQLGDDSKIAQEGSTVTGFLGDLDSWPNCHFLVAMRDNKPEHAAYALAQDWERSSPLSKIVTVGTMDLDEDYERNALLDYVREHVPAGKTVDDDVLLAELQGDPGTLDWWVKGQPEDEESLRKQAADARAYKYGELRDWFRDIIREGDSDKIDFLARLALMPEMGDEESWAIFKDIVQDTIPDVVVRDLHSRRVLDPDAPFPSFGHTSRYETAKAWWQTEPQARPHARNAMEELVKGNAGKIFDSSDASAPYAFVLPLFTEKEYEEVIDTSLRSVAECAFFILPLNFHPVAPYPFSEIRAVVNSRLPEAATLVSMALVNVLIEAEDDVDLLHRDLLLNELRELASKHSHMPTVVNGLAKGLFIALVDANSDQDLEWRDGILDELPEVAFADVGLPRVVLRRALGLDNPLINAKSEEDLARRDGLLDELRELASTRPEVSGIVEQLVKGLVSTLGHAKADDDGVRRDSLLEELRELASAHASAPDVIEGLAIGLVSALNFAKAEENLTRRDGMLEDLRELAATRPEVSGVVEQLAKGLLSTLIHVKSEEDTARQNSLLDDLRELHSANSDVPGVVEGLARAILIMFVSAKFEDILERQNDLLDELRELASANAEVPGVIDTLASGLSSSLNDAKSAEDLESRDRLLDELRELASAHSNVSGVVEQLAKNLLNTFDHAMAGGDFARQDGLLEELRELASAHSDISFVVEKLAMGLIKSLASTRDDEYLERCDSLLDELRELFAAHGKIRETLDPDLVQSIDKLLDFDDLDKDE